MLLLLRTGPLNSPPSIIMCFSLPILPGFEVKKVTDFNQSDPERKLPWIRINKQDGVFTCTNDPLPTVRCGGE